MSEGRWARGILWVTAAAGAVFAGWHALQAPPLPVPKHPYREVTRCASGPLDWDLVDANGDDHPDVIILCEEELLVASGLNGDTLWRQDLQRPFPGSFAAPQYLKLNDGHGGTGGVIVVEYPKDLVSFDAVTGRRLWSIALRRVHPSIMFHGDCLVVRDFAGYEDAFSARTGEPCAPPPDRRLRFEKPSDRFARVETTRGEGDERIVTLLRGDEKLWAVSCGSNCGAQRLVGAVLVRNWDDGCMCILNISRGQVTWVLKPQDLQWQIESMPPYLIAWRPVEPGASPPGRPVLEVFDSTSFRTRWRSDPDEPEAVWELTDHCEPTLPDTSESPLPQTCTDAVDGPCATGITPRAATGPDDVVIRMERTQCFGDCPSYVVSIFADGRVRYEGRSVDGRPDAQLAPGQLDELVRQLRGNGFFDLCNAKKQEVSHFPSMSIELWDGTHVKRVEAYLGNWRETEALRDLGDMIDHTVALDRPRLGPLSTSSL